MITVLAKKHKKGRWSPTMKIEDYHILWVKPGKKYLTHLTPKSIHAKAVVLAIYAFLVKLELLSHCMSVMVMVMVTM